MLLQVDLFWQAVKLLQIGSLSRLAFKNCQGKSRADFNLGIIQPHYLGDTLLQTLPHFPCIMRSFRPVGGNMNYPQPFVSYRNDWIYCFPVVLCPPCGVLSCTWAKGYLAEGSRGVLGRRPEPCLPETAPRLGGSPSQTPAASAVTSGSSTQGGRRVLRFFITCQSRETAFGQQDVGGSSPPPHFPSLRDHSPELPVVRCCKQLFNLFWPVLQLFTAGGGGGNFCSS